MSDSKRSFVRQGAWMVVATLAGGAGMTAVHVVVQRYALESYSQFKALLGLFYLVGAAQGGLWNLFAQQTASAHTPAQHAAVASAARRISIGILIFGLILGGILQLNAEAWSQQFKLPNSGALWATLGLAIATLELSILRGILQGQQNFTGLGLVTILDGFGRCIGVAVILILFHGQAAGAIVGALIGNMAALAVGGWTGRSAFQGQSGAVPWNSWVGRLVPLILMAAAMQVLTQFDNVFLQGLVPKDRVGDFNLSERYSPAAQIGFALTQFTVPLALVMFPRIARSAARSESTDAVKITFLSTIILGTLAAIGCTLLPWLPVRVLFSKANLAVATPLVPWFAWAMLLYTLANVLLSNLIAQAKFRIVPWMLGLAAVYVATLWGLRGHLLSIPPTDACRLVAQVIGCCNAVLLGLAAWMTWGGTKTPAPKAP